jgi:hypothetical protein
MEALKGRKKILRQMEFHSFEYIKVDDPTIEPNGQRVLE